MEIGWQKVYTNVYEPKVSLLLQTFCLSVE